jgi:ribosomal protein S18 acetylase RimI-like enzyme
MAPAYQNPATFKTSGETSPRATARREAIDGDAAKRKLAFLKRSGLFGGDTKGATIERALTLEDLRRAYKLVHHVYLGTGFLNPEPSGLRLRIYETTSETATFVAKKDGDVVGVLSVVGDSTDLGLPSNSAFKAEIDALRATGARICEVTNQAVSEEYRKSGVATDLMSCAIAHMMKSGYHFAVASVSPSHNGFYELMGFRRFGSERSYSQKLHDPVVALCLNIDRYRQPADGLTEAEKFLHHLATEANPFLEQVTGWSRQAVRHFLNPELLEQLFVADRNFLGECTPAELMILQRRWGQELFTAVTGTTYPPFTQPSASGRTGANAAGAEKLQPQVANPAPTAGTAPAAGVSQVARRYRLPQESSIRATLARRLSAKVS